MRVMGGVPRRWVAAADRLEHEADRSAYVGPRGQPRHGGGKIASAARLNTKGQRRNHPLIRSASRGVLGGTAPSGTGVCSTSAAAFSSQNRSGGGFFSW